ncbi:MAG: PASTA domain-containing protein [Acidobacteriota bacterium]
MESSSSETRPATLWKTWWSKPLVRAILTGVLRFGLLALVLGLLFVGSATISLRLALVGREVTVPDVTGLEVSEASTVLASNRLILEVRGERYDLRVEPGKILAQDPLAGEQTKRDRKVKVITSLGSKVITIPDLRGSAARKAQITLRQQGLRLGNLSYIHVPGVRESQVISQEPLPEADRVRDDRVSLLVSQGPREAAYVMPDLVGMDAEWAQEFLKRAGFRAANVVSEPGPGASRGEVVRQHPLAGYPVSKRDVVTIVVHKG